MLCSHEHWGGGESLDSSTQISCNPSTEWGGDGGGVARACWLMTMLKNASGLSKRPPPQRDKAENDRGCWTLSSCFCTHVRKYKCTYTPHSRTHACAHARAHTHAHTHTRMHACTHGVEEWRGEMELTTLGLLWIWESNGG